MALLTLLDRDDQDRYEDTRDPCNMWDAVLPVFALFHEWMHAFRYFSIDYPYPDNEHTAGWQNAMRLDMQSALRNAESIIGTHGFARADLTPSLGGIAAAGGECAGYTLDWAWAQRLNDQKWQAKVPDAVEEGGVWTNPVMAGELSVYCDITGTRRTRGYE
ncbi:hypothetical protein QC761_0037470 [Podospora bellae-mahoneyi]|uniref:SprT-like domain-containing protein n=1 Tax=Podospora bellae-mahoneyi TaxID=2093777 RepID=A0ABR0FPW4_9PEZI|nr:hypothetical protein QC761_0037470 [Podospora bellae-mahoneyi]